MMSFCLCEYRLPPRFKRDIRSSGMLHSVVCYFFLQTFGPTISGSGSPRILNVLFEFSSLFCSSFRWSAFRSVSVCQEVAWPTARTENGSRHSFVPQRRCVLSRSRDVSSHNFLCFVRTNWFCLLSAVLWWLIWRINTFVFHCVPSGGVRCQLCSTELFVVE
jgi:hypothetical protein